jgi:hypothetical protein
MASLLLYLFYLIGLPPIALAVLGSILIIFVLLRGKIWKAVDDAIEKYLPFTRSWPDWGRKVLLFILFLAVFILLRQIIYFILALLGFDIQGMIQSSIDMNNFT